jgi:hypothetical protein
LAAPWSSSIASDHGKIFCAGWRGAQFPLNEIMLASASFLQSIHGGTSPGLIVSSAPASIPSIASPQNWMKGPARSLRKNQSMACSCPSCSDLKTGDSTLPPSLPTNSTHWRAASSSALSLRFTSRHLPGDPACAPSEYPAHGDYKDGVSVHEVCPMIAIVEAESPFLDERNNRHMHLFESAGVL